MAGNLVAGVGLGCSVAHFLSLDGGGGGEAGCGSGLNGIAGGGAAGPRWPFSAHSEPGGGFALSLIFSLPDRVIERRLLLVSQRVSQGGSKVLVSTSLDAPPEELKSGLHLSWYQSRHRSCQSQCS
jgi:hypothetical protein